MEYPHDNVNYTPTKNNIYFEDDLEDERLKSPIKGTILAFLFSLPGSFLWLLLAYFTPFASLTGGLIIIGAMLGFKLGGKYMNKHLKNNLVIASSILIFCLTTAITSYTLYKQYTEDVLKQSTIDELRESFVLDLKNNGKSIEETEQMLKDKYNINGFDDIDGLNDLVIKTLGDTYRDSHKVLNVPDTYINSVLCLFQSIVYNSTIATPFIMNILCGIIIIILTSTALIKTKYFRN